MTMVSIPVSNPIPLWEFVLQETLGWVMRALRTKSPDSVAQPQHDCL